MVPTEKPLPHRKSCNLFHSFKAGKRYQPFIDSNSTKCIKKTPVKLTLAPSNASLLLRHQVPGAPRPLTHRPARRSASAPGAAPGTRLALLHQPVVPPAPLPGTHPLPPGDAAGWRAPAPRWGHSHLPYHQTPPRLQLCCQPSACSCVPDALIATWLLFLEIKYLQQPHTITQVAPHSLICSKLVLDYHALITSAFGIPQPLPHR